MTLRIAVIGTGRWGTIIANTLRTFDGVEVLEVRRGEEGPRDIDGVCVATPSASHAAVAIPYIDKGIPAFIEKPLSTSLGDAERILAVAQTSDSVVHVGHVYLYNPAFLTLCSLLPQIGTVTHVYFEGLNEQSRKDSSVLWDWLPHDISMALRVCGPGFELICARSCANTAMVHATFNAIPVISLVSSDSPQRRRCMLVVGEKGSLMLDERADKKLMLKLGADISYPSYGAQMPLTQELQAFLDAISTKDASRDSVLLGVETVRIITEIEQSLQPL